MEENTLSPRKGNIKRCHYHTVVKGCVKDDLALLPSPQYAFGFRNDWNHCIEVKIVTVSFLAFAKISSESTIEMIDIENSETLTNINVQLRENFKKSWYVADGKHLHCWFTSVDIEMTRTIWTVFVVKRMNGLIRDWGMCGKNYRLS